MKKKTTRNPWAWIPTLYFAEGIPYIAVMTISVIMYKRLGISNADIALYTSWLYLPWVIKPFWSPFVDILKTKRWWILVMQLFIGAGLAGVAFLIPVPFFFRATLAVFWLVAFSSATHDIAADGFYMLALDSHNQALYVGIRSTFYRIASIMGQGVLIIVAGFLESHTGLPPVILEVDAGPGKGAPVVMEAPPALPGDMTGEESFFIAFPSKIELGTRTIPGDSAAGIRKFALEQNRLNGFVKPQQEAGRQAEEKQESWWSGHISGPLGAWIRRNFGEPGTPTAATAASGNTTLAHIRLSKPPAPGESHVLVMHLDKGGKASPWRVTTGLNLRPKTGTNQHGSSCRPIPNWIRIPPPSSGELLATSPWPGPLPSSSWPDSLSPFSCITVLPFRTPSPINLPQKSRRKISPANLSPPSALSSAKNRWRRGFSSCLPTALPKPNSSNWSPRSSSIPAMWAALA